jgi:hypothetical protein
MTRALAFDGGAAAPPAVDPAAAAITRRAALAGLAGLAAAPALAAVSGIGAAPTAGDAAVATGVIRGGVRRFSSPVIAPGHRIRLPRGVKVLPAVGAGPLASHRIAPGGPYAWPDVPTRDGGSTDLSAVPRAGTPSTSAYLTGFGGRGWYEIADPGGAVAARVEWDARRMPYLWLWGEWGASKQYPFWGRFYTLALEPFSRHPVL